MAEKYESFDLSGTKIYVSEDHRFGTDAFLLAEFADPHLTIRCATCVQAAV